MPQVLHPRFFPFCRVPDSTYNATASSLEAQMAAYWKVKTWKVTYNGGNPNPPPGTVTAEGIYGYDVPNEKHLVCINEFKELSFTTNSQSFQEHYFSIIEPYKYNEYAASETLGLSFDLTYFPADDGTLGGFAYAGHGDPQTGENQTLQVTVPGGTLALKVFVIDSAPPRQPCFVTIEPETFWPYAG